MKFTLSITRLSKENYYFHLHTEHLCFDTLNNSDIYDKDFVTKNFNVGLNGIPRNKEVSINIPLDTIKKIHKEYLLVPTIKEDELNGINLESIIKVPNEIIEFDQYEREVSYYEGEQPPNMSDSDYQKYLYLYEKLNEIYPEFKKINVHTMAAKYITWFKTTEEYKKLHSEFQSKLSSIKDKEKVYLNEFYNLMS